MPAAWTGIALGLAEPGADLLRSRLSTYLHPLAGRPLAWHTLACMAWEWMTAPTSSKAL